MVVPTGKNVVCREVEGIRWEGVFGEGGAEEGELTGGGDVAREEDQAYANDGNTNQLG